MQARDSISGGFNVELEEHENHGMVPAKAAKYLAEKCTLVKIITVYVDQDGREFTVTQWARRGSQRRTIKPANVA